MIHVFLEPVYIPRSGEEVEVCGGFAVTHGNGEESGEARACALAGWRRGASAESKRGGETQRRQI